MPTPLKDHWAFDCDMPRTAIRKTSCFIENWALSAHRFCGGADFFYKALQYFTRTHFNKLYGTVAYHVLHALRPFYGGGKLGYQVFPDLGRIGNSAGCCILIHRANRAAEVGVINCSF